VIVPNQWENKYADSVENDATLKPRKESKESKPKPQKKM
jgi:hypothetical protein